MLNNDYLIRTFIDFPEEPNKEPSIKFVNYSIKNIIDKNENFNGKIRMSNYTVPFDFDGNYYIYIDFLKQNKRKFGIHDVTQEKNRMKEKMKMKKRIKKMKKRINKMMKMRIKKMKTKIVL